MIKDVSDYLVTNSVDNLLHIVDNTEEYIPIGAVTRDEFNAFRGINQYLWRELKQKPKRKYRTYQ